jgi:hypothetical protein
MTYCRKAEPDVDGGIRFILDLESRLRGLFVSVSRDPLCLVYPTDVAAGLVH